MFLWRNDDDDDDDEVPYSHEQSSASSGIRIRDLIIRSANHSDTQTHAEKQEK